MTPTKFLIGQLAVVCGIIIAGVWAGTQLAAADLGHQPRLGAPWFVLYTLPVYYPWRLFEWWYAYDAYAPAVFNRAGLVAASSALLGCAAAVIGALWRARQIKHATTYGSSRWASGQDIQQAGLLRGAGVFLGKWKDNYLRHDGPEHVMAFAPTRSGKGVGLVVPTLLSWTGSAVIHDIKGENWELTAGWRAKFSHCILFNPTDHCSARYNPLLEVRKGPHEVRDVQNIADILMDPEGALDRRNHWEKTSNSLLVGTILHVLYAEEEKTLARVATILSDPQRSFSQTLHHMMQTNHIGTPEKPMVHPVVASAAREVLNKAENERSGVLSTAMSFLGLYRDPTVARTTSACDWRVSDLMDGRQPVSLYLVIPPSDISRTKPLVRLMLNQIGRRLTEGLVGNDRRPKHQLLMMLDEFPALGRLDFFETALAFMAGYGIRAYLIAQSLNQISKAYGENNSILDNCHVRIAFSSNDERTAKRISDALGMTTETRAQKNYAGSRLALWLGHVMVSRQETARPLLTPGEIMQLPATDQLLLVSSVRPIRAQRVRYYEDRNLRKRVLAPPLLDVGDYADKPASRDHDWQGQVRGPDARLAVALPDASAAAQGGGKERQVETPAAPEKQATAPARIEPETRGPERTSPALAVEEVSGPVRRAYAMANGEDLDAHRGHGREFLPE